MTSKFKTPVLLPAAPTNALEAATKAYVDAGDTGTTIDALSALATPDSTDVFPVSDSGLVKKITLQQIKDFADQNRRNSSVANQTGFAADTYLIGSNVLVPTGKLQVRSMYRCLWNTAKTAAGLATPIIQVRVGTAGSTADTSRLTFTFAAGTAAADEGQWELAVTFRTVGSGTSTVIAGICTLTSNLSTTGLSPNVKSRNAVSAGFDSTVANLQIGVSVNGGASAAWTTNVVQADLLNLV